ncbi:MAG: phosphatidylserine decarboxylase family protein [Planctomycetales bacterium]|nr:phosphatidylserine decarboxylase family protein [Planctomycetales bacterium]
MSNTETMADRAEVQPLPENIRSVQPGSGKCYAIELAWGRLRRGWLRRFRGGYLSRMAQLRTGSVDGAPHEVLDPRDLKYCRNLCTADWPAQHDPYAWRERIPFARWGLAELQLMGWPLLVATIALCFAPAAWKLLAIGPAVGLGLVVYFFRDPTRDVPGEAGVIVSPADGKVVDIQRLDHEPFIGGPAVKIGIFLSIFNVHINRAPLRAKVIQLIYRPGLFLNALNPESAERNESMWIGLEEDAAPHRKLIVRQISGLIARRIVCNLRPGETMERGHKFGMIKLGSRTELILADDQLALEAQIGDKVQAGSTILARYRYETEGNR